MYPPIPPDTLDENRDRPHDIAGNYALKSNLPDEMLDSAGSLRPHWRQFVSMLDTMGADDLRRAREHARRLIHENGVSHNVYGDPNGLDRPWNLDLIPLLLSANEWGRVCEGLIQRARLLDRLLSDLYGPAETLMEGLLPPELVWANPGFLRSCHGVKLPQDRWLHLYAADLVRTADGQFEVLTDRTQAPSGAGYSLENRIVISRVLPEVFRDCNVERLAPFFGSLRETLTSLAPTGRDKPRIVLLTPGPYNETFFEHSYLARYLGYSLVQGNDLTVRDGNVYLKTLGGLQRVDVIVRRVDDDFCDPLELYAGSYLGVPGLLQSVRQGNVTIANALGAGILQAPGFLPFLPGLCRRLLDEELKLPSVSTWWCGGASELRYVIENLDKLVIKSAYPTRGEDPAFGQDLTRAQLADLADRIKARPERYVAQIQTMSCTVPALIDHDVEPRRFVVRSFLAACGDSYNVMNGALTRMTRSSDSLVVSLQHGGGSKDTWILSDGPVNQVTLLASLNQPAPFSRGVGDLPSRIADDLFWLGRYVERAEGQVRLTRVAFARLTDRIDVDSTHTARVLAQALDVELDHPSDPEYLRRFIEAVLADGDGDSLRGIISQVHRLAKILRDRLASDAWHILEDLSHRVSTFKVDPHDPAAGWAELLDSLVVALAAFVGLSVDSMMQSQAWRFLDMGRRIERVVFVAELLAKTIVNPGNNPSLLEAILEITESSFPYRRRYLMQLETHAIANLLLADEYNPRSVAFQLGMIDQHLTALPRDASHPNRFRDQHLLLAFRTGIQMVNLGELCAVPLERPREGLHTLLSNVVSQVGLLSNAIAQLYFSHATVSRESGHVLEELGS